MAIRKLLRTNFRFGTLIAMCYQTVWMMVYTTKNLIQCTWPKMLKRWTADAVAALLVCLTTSRITFQSVSYFGWFVMAVKVAVIAGLCIVAVVAAFYPNDVRQLLNRFRRKTEKLS